MVVGTVDAAGRVVGRVDVAGRVCVAGRVDVVDRVDVVEKVDVVGRLAAAESVDVAGRVYAEVAGVEVVGRVEGGRQGCRCRPGCGCLTLRKGPEPAGGIS